MPRTGRHVLFVMVCILLLSGCQPIQPVSAPVSEAELAQPVVATEQPVAKPTPTLLPVAATRVELKTDFVESQALAGNLLDDPPNRAVEVLLPPGYVESDARYPVLYALPWGDGYPYDNAYGFKAGLERLLRKGEVPPLIMVVPDAAMSLGHSQFRSSATIGDHEGFLTRELVDYIDSTYRTLPARESRGLAGCSMGGQATMRIGLEYPNVFSVLAPTGAFFDDSPWVEDYELVETFSVLPSTPAQVRAQAWNGVWWYIGAAAGVTSNPDNPPFYIDMPLRIVNGKAEFVPEVIDLIVAQDSVHILPDYLAQPVRLNAILIQLGLRDDQPVIDSTHEFAKMLEESGVSYQLMETDAAHCPYGWEVETLKFMAKHLTFESP